MPQLRPLCAAVLACLAAPAFADHIDETLPTITIEETRSIAEKNHLPLTTESITARAMADTINVVNTEDALKYLPSVLIRRRYIGDTQAPMSSRTTGINAGARTLIMADGVLLSTLVNNNNGNGSPQWFMVAPEEIERIDVMYGPFAATYSGNSYGAVTEITTRMPKRFEAGIKVNAASQDFRQYGTSDRYFSRQVSAILGNRDDALTWWLGINHLDSNSQPMTYMTTPQSTIAASATLPAIGGAFADRNRTGGKIQALGAGGLTHTQQDNAKIKLAYTLTPAISAAYTLGYWQNKADSHAQSYLTDTSNAPYFGATGGAVNIGGFSYNASTIGGLFSGNRVEQEHWMQSLRLKTKTQGPWDWEAVASNFRYAKDLTRISTGIYPVAQRGGAGRIADASGTGWTTLDLKGNWHALLHLVSLGIHRDQYKLASPTYNTADWMSGGNGTLFSDSRGKTSTDALWLQDAWQLAPSLLATLGGRYESWHAYDGYNLATTDGATFPVNQPNVGKTGFSPKLSIAWQAAEQWLATGSLGRALRFPTVGELYQNVQTGSTYTQANPYLKPEDVVAGELALEHVKDNGRVRVSLFEEQVSDTLISQTSTIAGYPTPVSFVQNVDKTRQRGIELSFEQKNVLFHGLDVSGSVTHVDARIVANSSYAATIPSATSIGKRTPYVPDWRVTTMAVYRPDHHWVFTLAGRYSGKMFATVDNTDINPATYQGFEHFFVADARIHYEFDKQWSAATGVDNLNNRKYFLFHPFPQRTFFAELKFNY